MAKVLNLKNRSEFRLILSYYSNLEINKGLSRAKLQQT